MWTGIKRLRNYPTVALGPHLFFLFSSFFLPPPLSLSGYQGVSSHIHLKLLNTKGSNDILKEAHSLFFDNKEIPGTAFGTINKGL